jgi:hypothetical protein
MNCRHHRDGQCAFFHRDELKDIQLDEELYERCRIATLNHPNFHNDWRGTLEDLRHAEMDYCSYTRDFLGGKNKWEWSSRYSEQPSLKRRRESSPRGPARSSPVRSRSPAPSACSSISHSVVDTYIKQYSKQTTDDLKDRLDAISAVLVRRARNR